MMNSTLPNSKIIGRGWIVYKSVIVRDDHGKEISKALFGQLMDIQNRSDGNRIRVEFNERIALRNGSKRIIGWIPKQAIAAYPVEYYAKLLYRNVTGKRIPVSNRYKGQKCGYIKHAETVEVIVKCGEWCLTNKGWTLFKWLKKYPGDFDDVNLNALAVAMLLLTAKEYKNAVNRIKMGKCHDPESYARSVERIVEIKKWFSGKEYQMYFSDNGSEKLDWLNETLGIDDKWIKSKQDVLAQLKKKGRIRKHDSAIRHTAARGTTSERGIIL